MKRKSQTSPAVLPRVPFYVAQTTAADQDLARTARDRPTMANRVVEQLEELRQTGAVARNNGTNALKPFTSGPLAGHWRIANDDGEGREYRTVFTSHPEQRRIEVWYIGPWDEAYVARGALARLRSRNR